MPTTQPTAAAAIASKIERIAWLAADNAADRHPSFERLARGDLARREAAQ